MEQRSQEHRTIHIMLTDDAPAPTTGRSALSCSSSAAKGKPKPRPKQRPDQQQWSHILFIRIGSGCIYSVTIFF